MPGVRIDDWKGIATAISPYVLAPGATVRQSNLQIKRPGELRLRPGMDSVYESADYSQIVGLYRVSNGTGVPDDLIVSARTSSTQNTIRYQTPTGGENGWSVIPSYLVETNSVTSPTFAEDRHGRVHLFHGNGVEPIVVSRSTKQAVPIGLAAPTIAPTVTPTGNGYFIERVDVLEGGGSYWAAPDIIVSGGGARVRDARLKAIVQGGAVVAVDVIDGGSGFQTAPTLTVDESSVKGVGFLGYGVIGINPGLQGLEPVFSSSAAITSGGSTVTNVAVIESVRVGARVTAAAGIPANATVASVNVANRSLVLSANATATNSSVTLTFNEPARTGSTGASLSHGFVIDPNATTIAYSFTSPATLASGSPAITSVASISRVQVNAVVSGTGIPAGTTVTAVDPNTGIVTLSANATASGAQTLTFVQGAAATFDGINGNYSALIPLTPATTSVGSGASALVYFTVQTDTLSQTMGTLGGVDVTWPLQYGWFGASASTLHKANDYWVNTDDCSANPANEAISWYYTDYRWWNNNYDFHAAFVPNFRINFHSRCAINHGANSVFNGVPNNGTRYSDLYVYDFSQISLRYYTGSRDELESATDTEDKWVWLTVPVQTNAGVPFIDVALRPAKKTGTTDYLQYAGYQRPRVRIWLTYCPNSWLNGVNDSQVNVGWRRTSGSTRPGESPSAANALIVDTAKGWWSVGQAVTTTGASSPSSRPVVDFRQGPNSGDGAGLTVQSVQIIEGGSGMEAGTFFAIQFDQINASQLWEGAYYQNNWQLPSAWTDGSIFRPAAGNPDYYNISWARMEKNPASPAFTDEYNLTRNPARLTKGFTQYRQRLYFRANTVQAGQQGPPGAVLGVPSISIPGSGFAVNDTAAFTLRQRSDLTSTATFSESYTYTFTARQITAPAQTKSITSIIISNGGTNYYGTPELQFAGSGYGLEMDAIVSAGRISTVNVINGGSGFTSIPTITASSEKARLIPVMRPAMRGTYRCAYRYADWSQTEVGQRTVALVSGSRVATVSSASGIEPGMVIEASGVPFMARVISISGTSLTLSAAATATGQEIAIIRDMTKPIYYSNFSPITDVDTTTFSAVPRPTTMAWGIAGAAPPPRATIVEFYRTSSDQSLVFYRLEQYGIVSGSTVNIVGADTLTDEELFDPDRPFYAAIPVVLPNGGLNAYRFGVPRNDMAVCAAYGDRLWYAVSTSGENANSIFFSEYDEFESCPAENELAIQNNQKSTDSLTGLVPFSTFLLCMQNSHCYAVSYNTEPSVDASIQLLAHRGMLSQGCHDLFDDNIYVMDERGIYVMNRSGGVESLSDAIRNYFDNNLLDLNYRSLFFLKVDQRNSILRAFVVTKGSGAVTPNVAFCYHINLKTWWTESWPNGLTCSVDYRKTLNEQDQPVYGAMDGDIYREGGLRDYLYRSIRSVSITNGGSGYQAAPAVRVATGQSGGGASFTAIVSGGSVTEILIDEGGFGYGTLTAGVLNTAVSLIIDPPPSGVTATATAQCSPLTLAGEEIPQASVPYAVKTGAMELINDGNARTRDAMIDRSVSVVYRPTPANSDLYLREFFNNSPQPRANVMQRDRGTGFVHDTTGAKTRLNMAASRSPLGQATGVAQAQFAGRNYSDMGGADRHVAVELSAPAFDANAGDPVPSEVLLYAMEINGVMGNGG